MGGLHKLEMKIFRILLKSSALWGRTRRFSAKILRYASRVISRYDRNGDETLSTSETKTMRGDPAAADLDKDGKLEVKEFAQYVANYGRRRKVRLLFFPEVEESINPSLLHPMTSAASDGTSTIDAESSSLSGAGVSDPSETTSEEPISKTFHVRRHRANLPGWFAVRDANGDGQVSMAEYAPKASNAELAEFARMDKDQDGVITSREILGPTAPKRASRSLSHTSARSDSRKSSVNGNAPSSDPSKPKAGKASKPASEEPLVEKSEERQAGPAKQQANRVVGKKRRSFRGKDRNRPE